MKRSLFVLAAAASIAAGAHIAAQNPPAGRGPAAPPAPMGFFVTSTPVGNGANLGGLAGADAHCQKLAAESGREGAGAKTWHAYLSTQGANAVNARDRIGNGPWANSRGAVIAQNLGHLHGDTLDQARLGNNLSRSTVLTEKQTTIPGAGDTPNQHDILTGSQPDGRAYTDTADHTCGNWTSSTDGTGAAQLGHFDRTGGNNTSWNSAHPSRGCSQPNLISTGGNGYLYCFAVN
jgi:hypothetical protein